MTTPFVVAFHKAEPFVGDVALCVIAAMQQWCRREGYTLGTPYREQDGNGAFESMLEALVRNEDVAGVVVPSLDHLGVLIEDRVSRISATGKHLFVANPTDVRR